KGRAEGRLRRLPGGQRDPGRHARERSPGAARVGDHGPRRGRKDADHGRSLRLGQGGAGRLALPRGRRPRRCDRARLQDPGRPDGRGCRDPSDRRELTILDQVFRDEWGRVIANLIGYLGDFDLAEEAGQEAFAIAAERWPRDGVPDNPRAWLVTTARNKAI